jgi:DNA modification methylase
MNKLILGNSLEELKTLEDNSVDSIVTDPPYELGFMGKSWDNTGIANNPNLWAECLRVLKPGGHLLAFSGTRTYHRMAVAIEDAGFEVRDMIEWVYGSGFPKSLNIGKAVDKLQGNEREVVGKQTNIANKSNDNTGRYNWNTENQIRKESIDITKGTSEWEGWGTALKPAHEPICMARKPISEKTVAKNVLKYGTGGINIDESRVGTEVINIHNAPKGTFAGGEPDRGSDTESYRDSIGRFPANLIHDNSEEVRECFPDAGKGNGKGAYNYAGKEYDNKETSMFNGDKPQAPSNLNDSGNASRFFKSIIYNPKASKSERNKGCKELEKKENAGSYKFREDGSLDGKPTDPKSNFHPTVKPIALMEYLIKMVTPKGGTVLDPFMGSGSTGVAAKKNGYDFIGIDMTPEYIEIAKARINHYEDPSD